jgi:hypothetical protein
MQGRYEQTVLRWPSAALVHGYFCDSHLHLGTNRKNRTLPRRGQPQLKRVESLDR